jgi:hypothetical protein
MDGQRDEWSNILLICLLDILSFMRRFYFRVTWCFKKNDMTLLPTATCNNWQSSERYLSESNVMLRTQIVRYNSVVD